MTPLLSLILVGILSQTVVLRLFICGNTAGPGINYFITSLIIISAILWLTIQAISGELRITRLGGLGALLLVWVWLIVGSAFWAGYKFAAFNQAALWLGDVLLFYLIVQLTNSSINLPHLSGRVILAVFLSTAVVIIFYSLYQYGWGLAELRQRLAAHPEMVEIPSDLTEEFRGRVKANEPFGTFVYQNSLAGFLVLIIPIFLAGAFHYRTKRTGLFYLIILALTGFILYQTGSKGGGLAGLVALLIFIILMVWPRLTKIWRLIIPFTGLAVLILMGLLLIKDESVQVRLDYWAGAWEVIKHNFWTGVGLNNFADHYTMYKSASAGEVLNPHNIFFSVFAELGVLGLITFLCTWLIIIIHSHRSSLSLPTDSPQNEEGGKKWIQVIIIVSVLFAFILAQLFEGTFAILSVAEIGLIIFFLIWIFSFLIINRSEFGLQPGLLAGILGFLLHSLVDFNFSEAGLSLSIWLAAGCLWSLQPSTPPVAIPLNPFRRIILMAGAVVIIGLNIGLLSPLINQENLIEEGRQNLTDTTPLKIEAGKTALLEASRINPYNIQPYLELATFYWRRRQPEKVSDYLDKAIQLSPYSAGLYYRKGRCLLEQENLVGAVESFRQAVLYYPTKPEYHYWLGKALALSGKSDEAVAFYKEALRLNQLVKLKRLKLTPEQVQEATDYPD